MGETDHYTGKFPRGPGSAGRLPGAKGGGRSMPRGKVRRLRSNLFQQILELSLKAEQEHVQLSEK